MSLNLLPQGELDKYWNEPIRPKVKLPPPAVVAYIVEKKALELINGRPTEIEQQHWDKLTDKEKLEVIWVIENL